MFFDSEESEGDQKINHFIVSTMNHDGKKIWSRLQNNNTFLYTSPTLANSNIYTFVSQTSSSPTGLIAATGYGNVQPVNPLLAGLLYTDTNNSINFLGMNPSTSPKALTALFNTNATLLSDLGLYTVQEMYSVVDTSGTEKVAFLYQPTDGRPLQYFDAVPCSTTSITDANGQVCLTVLL